MFATIARAVFGTANDRSLKAYQRRVPRINALEPAMEALSDEALVSLSPSSASGWRAAPWDDLQAGSLRGGARGSGAHAGLGRGISTCSWWAAWCLSTARSPK